MSNVVEKQVNSKNQIWFQKEEGKTRIGFTQSFLDAAIKECWHILPATTKTMLKENSPMMAIETNDGLLTVCAPTVGQITLFNSKAIDFPDQLTVEDIICVLDEKAPVVKEKPKKPAVSQWVDFNVEQVFEMPAAGGGIVGTRIMDVPRPVAPRTAAERDAEVLRQIIEHDRARLEFERMAVARRAGQ